MRIACVQLNTRDDKAANVVTALALADRAAAEGALLIALPETWNFKGPPQSSAENAEPLDGPSNMALADLAARRGVYVLAGSICERAADGGIYNTSGLFGPNGQLLACYRKIHLFDATAGPVVYRESETLRAGSDLVTAEVGGVTVGLSICYDLRFPELYLSLARRGARILLAPSAFTAYTGAAHWRLLTRARAVENGCFVVAPNQVGFHTPTNECFGHSLIVDPWGTVLAELPDGEGVCMADIDLERVDEVRAAVPSLDHRRPELYDLS